MNLRHRDDLTAGVRRRLKGFPEDLDAASFVEHTHLVRQRPGYAPRRPLGCDECRPGHAGAVRPRRHALQASAAATGQEWYGR
jgi:hypothetical protein